ncbi:MAG: ABC transporter ATP-binding protein [Candidatus Gracilibacteria bacterium]|nr:ABC transporter ATP-binding protein [Candidatus Gracilibacteria bacterium]
MKNSTFQTIKRFFSPLKGDRKFLAKAVVWFTFWGIDSLFIAIIIKSLTQNIQNGRIQDFHNGLFVLLFGMILFHILAYMMLRWGYVDYKVQENLNKMLLPSFFHIENNYFEKIGTGRSLSIVQKGIDTWATLLQEIMTYIPMSVIFFIMAVYIISTINLYYLIAFVIMLAIVGLLIHFLQKKCLFYRIQKKTVESEYMRQFIRNIMSKFEILQSNKINKEIGNLNGKINEALEINKKQHVYEHITYNTGNVTTNITRGLLLFFVGTRILEGTANFSDLVLVITVVGYFEKSINDVTSIYKKIIKNFSDITKLWEFIDESPKMKNIDEGKHFEYTYGSIRLERISFSYDDKTQIIDDFSLDIKQGTKTAFVGESGGGKTTLLKLIAGYISPSGGEILIDDQKLSEIKLMDYYMQIGYLSQDPSVFDGTIYENLTYALNYEPTDKEIEDVIRNSKCDFIFEFEKLLETEIGERGIRLSGGQKQRLAIAKIMLKNPNIILLDEPTSALDSISEQAVSEALHNLFRGRTVIVIAHRLQTVKEADDIIVIKQGKIIERGNHEILSKLDGEYRKMLDLQTSF